MFLQLSGIIAANVFFFRMVEKVNERVPPTMRFDEMGWYGLKVLRLLRLYRRIFSGKNPLFIAFISAILTSVVSLIIFLLLMPQF